VIARKRLDIGWRDLAFGIRSCFWPKAEDVDGFYSEESLECLSVRSGFDLFLTALSLPPGSEVLVSALTIPDIPRILRKHGLVPIPVDLDFTTAAPNAASLRRAISPGTKAILVAHLFGSRMPMDPILEVAREHGLPVWEDCAQAFAGRSFAGDPGSDVRMFSFGPIKTATALGGGVLFVKDVRLRERMVEIQREWPCQSRIGYLKKVITFGLFKALLAPVPYSIVFRLFRWLGGSEDAVITRFARSFQGDEFFFRIRHRPCLALRSLMKHRIRTWEASRLEKRSRAGRDFRNAIPGELCFGGSAAAHTFWLFPIVCEAPEQWRQRLLQAGFDAARSSTSLMPVAPPPERPEIGAEVVTKAWGGLLYLPVSPEMKEEERLRLAEAVTHLAREERERPVFTEGEASGE